MRKLKNKTCNRTDEIPPIILKNCAKVLSIPLKWIINTLIITGKFPRTYKEAKLLTRFKDGERNIKCNYRPLSNLSEVG